MMVFFLYWTLITCKLDNNQVKIIKDEHKKEFVARNDALRFYKFAKVKEERDARLLKNCKTKEDTMTIIYPLLTNVKIDSVKMIQGDDNNIPTDLQLNIDK